MKKIIVLSLLVLIGLLTACGERGKVDEETAAKYRPYLVPGVIAPDFTARDMENKYLDFSKYKGKVILMTFWRKKCEECVRVLDQLEKVHLKYKDRGFTSLAIDADNLDYVPSAKVIEFVKAKNLSYPVLLDDSFAATQSYKVINIPATFLIDRQGIVSHIVYAAVDWLNPENTARIEELL
ncbi:MAG: TlpA disulfide reductase family protein [bacterium]|nr:TlpA disulfide reductase family protein [bacterium]